MSSDNFLPALASETAAVASRFGGDCADAADEELALSRKSS